MTKIEIQGHDTHRANVRAIEISGSENKVQRVWWRCALRSDKAGGIYCRVGHEMLLNVKSNSQQQAEEKDLGNEDSLKLRPRTDVEIYPTSGPVSGTMLEVALGLPRPFCLGSIRFLSLGACQAGPAWHPWRTTNATPV